MVQFYGLSHVDSTTHRHVEHRCASAGKMRQLRGRNSPLAEEISHKMHEPLATLAPYQFSFQKDHRKIADLSRVPCLGRVLHLAPARRLRAA